MGMRTDEPADSAHGDRLNIAYAAGIFDGEGCIMINMGKRKNRPATSKASPRYCIRASVSNTDYLLLQRFKDTFNGSIQTPKRLQAHHAQGWTWYVTSKQAEIFLMRIRPYLLVKYRQVALALEFQSNIQKGRKQLTADDLAMRESFRMAISSLNQRKAVPR